MPGLANQLVNQPNVDSILNARREHFCNDRPDHLQLAGSYNRSEVITYIITSNLSRKFDKSLHSCPRLGLLLDKVAARWIMSVPFTDRTDNTCAVAYDEIISKVQ